MKSTKIFVVVFAYLSATKVASKMFAITQLTGSRLTDSTSCFADSSIIGSNAVSVSNNKGIKESRIGYLIASNVVLSTASVGAVPNPMIAMAICNSHAKAAQYVPHPFFNSITLENDISLIRLRTGFNYGFIQLPTPFMIFINYERTILIAVRWNSPSTGNNSQINQLKIGEPLSSCSFGNYTNFICVSNDVNNGIASNNGDALYDGPQLVGVRSHSRGNYDVYTRVDRYLEWISSFIQMASNSTITV